MFRWIQSTLCCLSVSLRLIPLCCQSQQGQTLWCTRLEKSLWQIWYVSNDTYSSWITKTFFNMLMKGSDRYCSALLYSWTCSTSQSNIAEIIISLSLYPKHWFLQIKAGWLLNLLGVGIATLSTLTWSRSIFKIDGIVFNNTLAINTTSLQWGHRYGWSHH